MKMLFLLAYLYPIIAYADVTNRFINTAVGAASTGLMMGVVIVIVVYYQKYKENRLRRKLLSERKGFTRLMDFCAQGDLTNVKAELSKGANLDQQDEGGATALIYAVMNNKDEVIRFLVESGVDIHLRTKTGLTALQIAQNNKYHNVVAMLTNVSTK